LRRAAAIPEVKIRAYDRFMRSLFLVVALLFISQASAVPFVPKGAEAEAAEKNYKPTGSGGEANANVSTMPASTALPPGSTFSDCKDGCPAMVVVRAGEFLMGSGRYVREEPQHIVTFATQFAVGKFDITFDEWAVCAKDGGCSTNPNPSDEGWGRGNRPVINVSWVDANDYVSWLSKKTGREYRLLTEAEWEYVARAGSTTNYPWGNAIDCGKASYDGGLGSPCYYKTGRRSFRGTQPVGRYPPNGWGLYDMHGNVWQWCEDSWHPNYRGAPVDGSAWQGGDESMSILRGGAWNYAPSGLRSADRNWLPRSARTNFLGFRVARSLEANVAIQVK
jgi:formylglycine-generating enzyme required for sulfatase activity